MDTSYAMELNLLLEFLSGEALDPTAQNEVAHVSRLIIAGNSVAPESKTTYPDLSSPESAADRTQYGG